MVRLVLFDIDGTLIATGGAGEKSFAKVCSTEFSVPGATERIQFAGRTDVAIVREFFTNHQIEPSQKNFTRFFDSYIFWLDHILSQLDGQVLPGVEEWIAELGDLPEPPLIGLLTGNLRLGAQLKLTRYKLWHHFKTGGFADDSEDRNKIAIAARERGCRLLNRQLKGDEILVIGDTPLDIQCANTIEANILAVATGKFDAPTLRNLKPTWTASNLNEIRPKDIWLR